MLNVPLEAFGKIKYAAVRNIVLPTANNNTLTKSPETNKIWILLGGSMNIAGAATAGIAIQEGACTIQINDVTVAGAQSGIPIFNNVADNQNGQYCPYIISAKSALRYSVGAAVNFDIKIQVIEVEFDSKGA